MKKITLLILCTFTTILIQSQNTNQNKWIVNEAVVSSTARNASQKVALPTNIDLFKKYSRISNNCRYGALGAGSLSAGLFLGFACVKDRYKLDENKKEVMTVKSKALLLGGCVAFFAAIVCEIKSIEYKTKANSHLSLQLTQNGMGLAYVF